MLVCDSDVKVIKISDIELLDTSADKNETGRLHNYTYHHQDIPASFMVTNHALTL